MANRFYGWVPDTRDNRDYRFEVTAKDLPPKVDLRDKCPPVYDQGQLGSCTGNAIAGLDEFVQIKEGLPTVTPSRLFIYYNERVMEGTVDTDSGAQIRDGMKSIASQGVCPETDWPYDISQFAVKPPDTAYADAKQHMVITYAAVPQSLSQMKGALAEGFPFVFGFLVYQSFESEEVATTGMVPMPHFWEQPIGGHAVVAVGYDDSMSGGGGLFHNTPGRFIVRNSWGEGWGDKGYFYMPYNYLTRADLSSDLWVINKTQ